MPQTKMNEAEENTLRTLLARYREQSPQEFITMLLQTLLNRLEDNVIVAYAHKDDDDIRDGMLVVFKGVKPAAWAEESLLELRERLKDLAGEGGE